MPVWLKQQQQKNKTPSASLINQLLFKMLNSIQRKNEFTSTLTLLKTTGSIQTIETLEDLKCFNNASSTTPYTACCTLSLLHVINER